MKIKIKDLKRRQIANICSKTTICEDCVFVKYCSWSFKKCNGQEDVEIPDNLLIDNMIEKDK